MKSYALFLLFVSNSLNSMQKIEKADDVNPFAGKVVAYTTQSYYFGANQGYSNSSQNKYGHVSSMLCWWQGRGSEQGYFLYQVLGPGEIAGTKALIGSLLEKAELHMREVTGEEAGLILNALDTNQIRFEYDSCGKQALIKQFEENV